MDAPTAVVPVRFSGGGLTMQTTTSKLSASAAFVRCLVQPRQGAKVTVKLMLPGTEGIELQGVVMERVAPGTAGKFPGFWVDFGAPQGPAADHLRRFVESQSPSRPGTGKRAFPRHPARIELGWASPRDFLVAYSENISRGGIFVVTESPPELGTTVELLLSLPDGEEPARTMAQVIQRLLPAEAARLGRSPGAGLQFVGADDAFRARLDRCIDHLLVA